MTNFQEYLEQQPPEEQTELSASVYYAWCHRSTKIIIAVLSFYLWVFLRKIIT